MSMHVWCDANGIFQIKTWLKEKKTRLFIQIVRWVASFPARVRGVEGGIVQK